MTLALLLLASLPLCLLGVYALRVQRQAHREHVRDLQARDTDLLDRLMYVTGNQSYVRTKSEEARPLTEEEKQKLLEMEEWGTLG